MSTKNNWKEMLTFKYIKKGPFLVFNISYRCSFCHAFKRFSLMNKEFLDNSQGIEEVKSLHRNYHYSHFTSFIFIYFMHSFLFLLSFATLHCISAFRISKHWPTFLIFNVYLHSYQEYIKEKDWLEALRTYSVLSSHERSILTWQFLHFE